MEVLNIVELRRSEPLIESSPHAHSDVSDPKFPLLGLGGLVPVRLSTDLFHEYRTYRLTMFGSNVVELRVLNINSVNILE